MTISVRTFHNRGWLMEPDIFHDNSAPFVYQAIGLYMSEKVLDIANIASCVIRSLVYFFVQDAVLFMAQHTEMFLTVYLGLSELGLFIKVLCPFLTSLRGLSKIVPDSDGIRIISFTG
ncbi:hypothetical protein RF11_09166 [Thelohanellus kitauei]|uniref:Uncharacterized protein n=1 Tax=Thelohanellus kitauei TaxID=669202 RepID=A0A0C2NB66_THEKT|nr:hypothetical protein RF11_09166 [Thelohanellus kitauei]